MWRVVEDVVPLSFCSVLHTRFYVRVLVLILILVFLIVLIVNVVVADEAPAKKKLRKVDKFKLAYGEVLICCALCMSQHHLKKASLCSGCLCMVLAQLMVADGPDDMTPWLFRRMDCAEKRCWDEWKSTIPGVCTVNWNCNIIELVAHSYVNGLINSVLCHILLQHFVWFS